MRVLIHRVKNSLNGKLICSIGIILVVTTSFFGYTAMWLQKRQLSDQIHNQGIFVSSVIQKTIWQAMLHCDIPTIQRVIDEVVKQHEIYQINLYNAQGKIFVSSQSENIGHTVDKQNKACVACHGDPRSVSSLPYEFTRIFSLNGKDQFLGVVTPIYNKPSCYTCHDSQVTVLGVLDVIFSLETVKYSLQAFQQEIVGYGIITFMVIAGFVYFLLRHLVHKPVKALVEATQKIRGGDYGFHVAVTSQDELGMLSNSFNSMVKDLKDSQDTINRWNQELEDRVREATLQCEMANQQLREAHISCQIANRDLQEYDKLRSRYVRIVAHELRTPLSNITSSMDILLKGYLEKVTDQQADMIKIAKKNAGNLLNLINDLLNIGRVEQGEIEKNRQAVSLEDLVKEAIDSVQTKAAEKSISLFVTISPPPPLRVFVDSISIGHLLTNLMGNAVKYTPEGGKITVQVKEQADEYVVSICDTGIGIPEEDVPHIFAF